MHQKGIWMGLLGITGLETAKDKSFAHFSEFLVEPQSHPWLQYLGLALLSWKWPLSQRRVQQSLKIMSDISGIVGRSWIRSTAILECTDLQGTFTWRRWTATKSVPASIFWIHIPGWNIAVYGAIWQFGKKSSKIAPWIFASDFNALGNNQNGSSS